MVNGSSSARWKLDVVDERLWDGDSAIKLTPKTFQILHYIASNPNRLITKDEILDAVWSDSCVTEGLVKDYIADLRRALKDNPKEPDCIETVHGRGYRFIGDIVVVNGIDRVQTVSSSQDDGRSHRPAIIPIITVLPFSCLGMDKRWDLLAQGLCADTIFELTQFPDLSVIAHKSSLVYKNAHKDVADIGKELNANYILDGSIQEANSRIRIAVGLIDVRSRTQLWSDRYDVDIGDLFTIQDHIVEKIATSLSGFHGEIIRAERKRLGRSLPSTLEAYELYLLGYECESRKDRENTFKGRELLEKAVSLDPLFSRAWTVLGWICNDAVSFGLTRSSAELCELGERGREAVIQAISLDPRDPIAIIERGAMYAVENDLTSARDCIERAMDIGANNVDALALNTKYVSFVLGRPQQALEMMNRALVLNPHAPRWYYLQLVRILYFVEENVALIDAAKRASDVFDTRIFEILAHAQQGDKLEVRSLYSTLQTRFPGCDMDKLISTIPLVFADHICRYRNGMSVVKRILVEADQSV